MITLQDIARLAGVSHSTVSRALAGSPLINPDTRQRIQLLAHEAGYQVNQVARNLKVRSTCTIGLVVPEVLNPYYPKVVQLVADLAREAGYNLQLQLSGADQKAEATCIASLREQRVDGILLVTAEHGLVARDQVEALLASGVPIVLMGWVEDAEHIDMVMGDDSKGGSELARHLIGIGHSRIAILGKTAHRGVYDRLFGFRAALEEAGIVLSEDLQIEATSDIEVKRGVMRLLALPAPPTAIFAYQDSLAALVIKHLTDACLAVPQEMTVVGFDDLDLAAYLCPHLTTVGGHIESHAFRFVSLLIERIRKASSDTGPQHIVITPRLVVRGSCGPPRKEETIGNRRYHPNGYTQCAPTHTD